MTVGITLDTILVDATVLPAAIGPAGPIGPQGPLPWAVQPTQWAPTTAYSATAPASIVVHNGASYVCKIAHTSTSIFDVSKWTIICDPGTVVDAAQAYATAASGSATTATTKAAEAAASELSASGSAATATTKAADAAAAELSATGSAATATAKATEAAASSSTATTKATEATTKAAEAAAAELSAAGSASTAATKATEAAASASTATLKATEATTKAAEAAASASTASAAQVAAQNALDAVLTAYDNFDDRYLGSKPSDPTLDNDGNPLIGGSLYFNSGIGALKVYTGVEWTVAYVSGIGVLQAANNLSELGNVLQARINLGLGTAATHAAGDFATPADIATLQTEVSGKAATAHGHAVTDVTGLQTALDGKAPSAHAHSITDVSGLQTALDGKAPTSHTHTAAEVSGLAASATTDTTNADNITAGVLGSTRGGAGTVNGVMKANGSGAVSQASAGTDYVAPNTSTAFSKPQYITPTALTSGAAVDASVNQSWTANVNGSTFSVANPTGGINGAYYALLITFTTANTLTFASSFKGVAAYVPTATAGAEDHLVFRYNGTYYECVGYATNVKA